jgi:hypothetical protein
VTAFPLDEPCRQLAAPAIGGPKAGVVVGLGCRFFGYRLRAALAGVSAGGGNAGIDNLARVDPMQIRVVRGVGMTELELDDVRWHAFAGELDGVRVPQLMQREAAADTRLGRERPQSRRTAGAVINVPRISRNEVGGATWAR